MAKDEREDKHHDLEKNANPTTCCSFPGVVLLASAGDIWIVISWCSSSFAINRPAAAQLLLWLHFPSILESSPSVPSETSFSGDSASSSLKLPDLGTISGSGCATWWFLLCLNTPDIGDRLRAGLFAPDLLSNKPLVTSLFKACFSPFYKSAPHPKLCRRCRKMRALVCGFCREK
ncbi:hypothetical protein ACFX2H_012771 [Malus domestica]